MLERPLPDVFAHDDFQTFLRAWITWKMESGHSRRELMEALGSTNPSITKRMETGDSAALLGNEQFRNNVIVAVWGGTDPEAADYFRGLIERRELVHRRNELKEAVERLMSARRAGHPLPEAVALEQQSLKAIFGHKFHTMNFQIITHRLKEELRQVDQRINELQLRMEWLGEIRHARYKEPNVVDSDSKWLNRTLRELMQDQYLQGNAGRIPGQVPPHIGLERLSWDEDLLWPKPFELLREERAKVQQRIERLWQMERTTDSEHARNRAPDVADSNSTGQYLALREMRTWLNQIPNAKVQIYSGPEYFLASFVAGRPGVLILNNHLPGTTGMELIKRYVPAQIDVPVLMVTAFADVQTAVHTMKIGTMNMLEVTLRGDELLRVLEHIPDEEQQDWPPRQEAAELRASLASLTSREREVMLGLFGGRSNKDVATKLGISPLTVEIHRARMLRKARVDSVTELVRRMTIHTFIQTIQEQWNKLPAQLGTDWPHFGSHEEIAQSTPSPEAETLESLQVRPRGDDATAYDELDNETHGRVRDQQTTPVQNSAVSFLTPVQFPYEPTVYPVLGLETSNTEVAHASWNRLGPHLIAQRRQVRAPGGLQPVAWLNFRWSSDSLPYAPSLLSIMSPESTQLLHSITEDSRLTPRQRMALACLRDEVLRIDKIYIHALPEDVGGHPLSDIWDKLCCGWLPEDAESTKLLVQICPWYDRELENTVLPIREAVVIGAIEVGLASIRFPPHKVEFDKETKSRLRRVVDELSEHHSVTPDGSKTIRLLELKYGTHEGGGELVEFPLRLYETKDEAGRKMWAVAANPTVGAFLTHILGGRHGG